MKNMFSLILLSACSLFSNAQDFSRNLVLAKLAYSAGDLEKSRFAMQQMITDIDKVIGNEVLKLLPTQMEIMTANTRNDNVTANSDLTGVLIHRDYGSGKKICSINIAGDSPLVSSINAILSLPFMGNSNTETQKVVKIESYKAIMQKTVDAKNNKTHITLQIPINSSLLTFTVRNSDEADVLKYVKTIPVQQIAKMVQ